jgi:hypothetical protein
MLKPPKNKDVNLDDTARIDRRQSVIAQIEAALLADQLSLEQTHQATGTDPYNSGKSAPKSPKTSSSGIWRTTRR